MKTSYRNYEISRDLQIDHIAWLNKHKKSKPRKRYAVYELHGSQPQSDLGRTLEREVFEYYFGNDAKEMASEYGLYEDNSDFIIVIDHKLNSAVGVVRLVRHGENSLKTLVDTTTEGSPWKLTHEQIKKDHKINYDKTWDIATIAVKRRYRNKIYRRLVRSLLLHKIHHHALSNDAEHWVALLDDIHLKTFQDIGIPIDRISGSTSKPYLGSKATTPIIIRVHGVAPGIKKRSKVSHNFLVRGKLLRRIASF